jgi:thioredoxin reductase (NADPH)|eukprot:TRINITY_DN8524_c0_g1_i1.p1 TRINITY_DN8524_c0_g1~~TRINITY_DN8524_c0_g1_i1.p1  ORF type:complete len:539 (+),score=301.16 TRINITY_DN8524_c0_g1_i1:65-1618(+)
MSAIEVDDAWFGVDPADAEPHGFEYDLAVIGGGSGGLAAAREAVKLGQKTAVFDFVTPSVAGTTYGIGGTCVNVGCIPKKLFHYSALLGEAVADARKYGWTVPEDGVTHDWATLVQGAQDHIGSLNWGYRTALRTEGVDYINGLARFADAHTIVSTDKRGREKTITARRVIVAVGGRPRYPDVPGAELGISSDDLFKLERAPGKTLCVGASYVSLECAGFLTGLGYDTTVMVRSIFLRGFDQQMAEMVGGYMAEHGTKFIRGSVPSRLEKVEGPEGPDGPHRVRVYWKKAAAGGGDAEEESDVFDSVFWAIGRDPCTARLDLDKAGLTVLPNGKFAGGNNERTAVPHIYAVGDCLEGNMELTPVAIQAGRRLVHRLYEPGYKLGIANKQIPSTVFTPLEYGCIGLSEEDARTELGAENVEVVHSHYQPLEWTVSHREDNACYLKLVYNKADSDRIVGFHIAGPNAGEITQGFGIAMTCRATLRDVQLTIGIHPTTAEEVTQAEVTKSSGKDPKRSGC